MSMSLRKRGHGKLEVVESEEITDGLCGDCTLLVDCDFV